MTNAIFIPGLLAVLSGSARPRVMEGDPPDGSRVLLSLSEATFRDVLMAATLRRTEGGVGHILPVRSEEASVASPEAPILAPEGGFSRGAVPLPGGVPPHEAEVIAREAERAGIDPSLLVALRRVENGGPGREFGVLAVPAPGLERQAQVAANTIRKTLARFQRQRGEAVDPATGRYTEEFLRFLSARYAPLAAANDPTGLNRFHAANLIGVYRRLSA